MILKIYMFVIFRLQGFSVAGRHLVFVAVEKGLPTLVPRASVTFVQRMGQRTLWKNPKPEPQNPGSGLTAPA